MRGLPKFDDPNLVIGTEGFSDSCVYRVRDDLLMVQSLDFFPPLVDDPFLFGQIAAANSLSDIYAMGAQPTTALNIVGFPDDQPELQILHEILAGGAERVGEAGAVIGGGHTVRDAEIKYGLSVTGFVHPDALLSNRKATPGDIVILTKPLGTGFVTTAFRKKRCPQDVFDAATNSMRALNKVASQAAVDCGASAATDITGFGLAGHAGEMAQSSEVTIELHLDKLPVLPGAAELIRQGYFTRASATNRSFVAAFTRIELGADKEALEFAFDAQTSGGLLLSVAEARADELVQRARDGGAEDTCVVGRVLEREDSALVLKTS